jgi:hypothetical protein
MAVTIVACTACATPPDREMQQAEDAIASARAEGAAEYAATDLEAAEAALARAREAVALRDYRLALSHALDGRERAQTARAQAGAARTAARTEANQVIARLDAAIVAARTRLGAAHEGGPSPGASNGAADVITHATARLQEARAAFARGDFAAALRLATDALPTLDTVDRDPGRSSSSTAATGEPGRI